MREIDKNVSLQRSPRFGFVLGLMLLVTLEVVDTTVVNIILPHLKGSFGATSDQITWSISSYMVATAIIMPLTGYFVRKFGQSQVLLVGSLGFIISSVFCGLSSSLLLMVFFRLLQGGFGAVLIPISQALLLDKFSKNDRAQIMAIWGIALMVGPLIGPILGGIITETLSWRWVFFINLPIGIVAILLIFRDLEFNIKTEVFSTDWYGMVLLAVFLGFLQMALDLGHSKDWFDSDKIIILICFSATAGLILIYHCFNNADPIIKIHLFRDTNFLIGNIIMAGYGMAMYAVIVLLPIAVQELFNYPVLNAGFILTPRAIVSALLLLVLTKILVVYFSSRWAIVIGLFFSMLGCYQMSNFSLNTDTQGFVIPGMIMGVGMAFVWSKLSVVSFDTIEEKASSDATGLFNLMRTMGGSIGVAICSSYLVVREQVHWNYLSQFISNKNPNFKGLSLPDQISPDSLEGIILLKGQFEKQVQIAAFNDTFLFICVIFILMMPLSFLLKD